VIEAKFDMPKLERSLKKASKAFGDSTKQAVARWSVQCARELAVSTQVYGKTGTRQKQNFAIEADARRVIFPVDKAKPSKTGRSVRYRWQGKSGNWPQSRFLKDEQAVHDWIEMNRTRRRARTAKLPFSELAICTADVFKRAMKTRFMRSGMAKGGWLGAGKEASKFQTGAQKINIGQNFLGYAQKHGHKGDAKLKGGVGFRPIADLVNNYAHVSNPNVLAKSEINKAVGFGLRKTINWYRMAAKKALDQ
jgi:hypothetical protein